MKSHIKNLANAIQLYTKEYKCSLLHAAQDFDEPVSVSDWTQVFEFLKEPISKEDLNKIGTTEEEVNTYFKETYCSDDYE